MWFVFVCAGWVCFEWCACLCVWCVFGFVCLRCGVCGELCVYVCVVCVGCLCMWFVSV